MPNVARKTRSGEPCQSRRMANGRCRMHGGSSTGAGDAARPGNQSATKHGIYGDLIHQDELACVDGVMSSAGVVENELLIARLQLRRALRAQAKADDLSDGMEVYETIEREGAENATAHSEIKKKLRDYPQIIDRLLARIESLEKTRAVLLADRPPTGKDDVSPVGKIIVEVVSARNKNGNDGAAS
ncbi:HGGxSTG domain-containing protein [Undibacterium arcticum]|uniref:HGGxSTG domain-containing protein n=1 Tax=Undibacterium arcticum TaxID=1762892 RepID=UPI00360A2735